MRVVTSKPTKTTKTTQTAYIAKRCEEVDEWLKTECGKGDVKHRELELIKTEYDLLRRFCPDYGQTMFKKTKKFNRKRKVSKMYVMSDVCVPRTTTREGNMIDAEQIDEHHWCGKTKYVWERDRQGNLIWSSEEPILEREISVPKCNRCLHGDAKCKYLERVFETIKRKCDRKKKGSYEFRTMLIRIMGFSWFNEFIEIEEVK
jgi:hypothetical protein